MYVLKIHINLIKGTRNQNICINLYQGKKVMKKHNIDASNYFCSRLQDKYDTEIFKSPEKASCLMSLDQFYEWKAATF